MMERLTTITAEQFIDQDYDDIVFDNQAVVTFGDLKVIDITPRTDEFVMLWVYSERIGFDKVKVLKGEVLGVRWLDTAQAKRDAEAYAEFEAGFQAAGGAGTVNVYPGVDKQGYDILSGGKLDRWKHDKGDAFEYALALANDNIRALQTERDELASKLAAAGAERVAALETVYEAVVQCDLQSDMLDAYKAPYDETIHTDNINFDALNEWADLSNALDYLRDNEATPQPAPANSELVAAVKDALTDLEAIATGMTGDLTPANVANIAIGKLAAALKGE